MKRLLFIVFTFFTLSLSAQQFFYLSGGYNASFANPKGFNTVVDNYNASRTWLKRPMEHIGYLDGSFWSISGISEIWLLDLSYARRSATVYAQGDAGSGMMQRDIKFSAHTFNLGLGLNLTRRAPFIGLGYNFDFGANKMETRIGTMQDVDGQDFEKLDAPLLIGGSLYLQILLTGNKNVGLGLMLRPYYHFDINDANYTWVNEDLNLSGNTGDYPTIRGRINHFGLQAALILKVGN